MNFKERLDAACDTIAENQRAIYQKGYQEGWNAAMDVMWQSEASVATEKTDNSDSGG